MLPAKVESGVETSSVDLEESFQRSDQYQVTKKHLDGIMEDLLLAEKGGRRAYSQRVKYATSFLWQVSVCACL